MKFGRRSRVSEEIPNASLADIAFLLLIFFMVSSGPGKIPDRRVTMLYIQYISQVIISGMLLGAPA